MNTKKKSIYIRTVLSLLLFVSITSNVYLYFQNKGGRTDEVNTGNSTKWTVVSQDEMMKVESGFIKVKAEKSTSYPNNDVSIQTRAFIKNVGELYLTHDKNDAEPQNTIGSLWFKNLHGKEEKLVDFTPSYFMGADEFSVDVITDPNRVDIAIASTGLHNYLIRFFSDRTIIEKIALVQQEYKHFEEIIALSDGNIIVQETKNETSGGDNFDPDKAVTRFWSAPISDLTNKMYLGE